ncbi:MAG: MBL fold metallo-hydrolase [Mogibacterium sp.]|nr:MBL fold metallo-hydrolase [Mogibacterium sp.]
MILLVMAISVTPAITEGLELTMVDVGAAECIIISVDGGTMIVDAGYAKSWESIDQAVQDTGTDSISYFVITHPHADHIGSATKIIENYDIQTVLLPPITYESAAYGHFEEVLVSSGIPVEYPYVGDQYMLGNAQITIYGPHPVAYSNPNDWSIVLMVEYAGRRILLTGDIEAEAEYDLLAYSDLYPLDADVLKVAHHGSNTSSTYDFVSAVSPQYAIISCASDADTEYPHVETAMTLYDCGIEDVFLTSTSGNITVEISPTGELSIASELSQK